MAARQKRMKMIDKKRKLPSFKSDRTERKFWSRHSIEEFGDQLEDLDVQIRPARTEQIALRLYKDDLETLKKLAKRRGVGHTTLARSIVESAGSPPHTIEADGTRYSKHRSPRTKCQCSLTRWAESGNNMNE